MIPLEFVAELKRIVRDLSSSTRGYLEKPPIPDPQGHLGEFARWYQELPEDQKKTAAMLMDYVAEESLFGLLNVLDNLVSLNNQRGRFELFHVEGESRTMLNDPDGDLFCDLFNVIA